MKLALNVLNEAEQLAVVESNLFIVLLLFEVVLSCD
jgi:hypothetical protein